MRSMFFGLAAVLAVTATGPVTKARAQGNICAQLWQLRNSIYKEKGFCFKTARAIRYFGNAGCRFDNEAAVPLTSYERQRIAVIQSRERALACPQ
jgi:YARHG domain